MEFVISQSKAIALLGVFDSLGIAMQSERKQDYSLTSVKQRQLFRGIMGHKFKIKSVFCWLLELNSVLEASFVILA